jgi:hypothetical protein
VLHPVTLWLGPLLVGAGRIGLVGLVMTDHASGGGADFAMSGNVAGDSPDDGALDASLGFSGGGECHTQNGDTDDKSFHNDFLALICSINSP